MTQASPPPRPSREASDATAREADAGAAEQATLRQAVARQAKDLKQAERDRSALLRYAVNLSAVAGLFVVPLVAGAYLGRWLDERSPGFSARWTVSGILLGLAVGAWNVYRYIKEHS